MDRYNNYHKHDCISSIITPDSNTKFYEYCERAIELGEKNVFTTNHGTGGDIFEALHNCDEYGLNCKSGFEGYIVKNPLEKDNKNYHIVIIPKTNVARRKMNKANSRAHKEGYYYKPRLFLDDLLNNFDSNELYITTACVAGILRDEDSIQNIFMPLYEKYGKNLMLEVQTNSVDIQNEMNEKAIKYSKELGLYLIGANDSHYIYPHQYKERIELLKGKGINYGDEDAFILDYPDYNTMVERFQKQGILNNKQILQAMESTLIFDECENIVINREIKMPTIYPNKTEDEKIEILKDITNKKFVKVMEVDEIPKDKQKEYVKEIKREMQVIEETKEVHTSDYFLLNVELFDLAINKYGGILTRTGRGSCGSYLLNKILGLTEIDRLTTDLPLYSERFISSARLLENKALPDFDANIVSQEPFVKASRELLGDNGCYPMVAYGTMKESEAFRNVCRSAELPYDEVNEVGKNIDKYRNDPYWSKYIDEAQKYVGTIISASVHPCAHILLNEDIEEEVGVIKVGDNICAMITSGEADEFKYCKNDYLIVSVWDIISKVFNKIGQPIMTIKQLIENLDDRVWELFEKGLTCTLNQVDGDWATELVMKYKPRRMEDLAMFVSSIRPSFANLRDGFINRAEYTTGSKELDELLSSTGHRVLFQESIMQYFEWLGISPSESIGLIKKISKKKIHQEDFDELEKGMSEKWIENTGSIDGFKESWEDMQEQMKYSFNSPHGVATALDCLYCAYLKVNYPVIYYSVVLNIYKDDLDKTNRLVKEMEYFGIRLKGVKFGYSTSEYGYNVEEKLIYKSVSSIKNLNDIISDQLYELSKSHYSDFFNLLKVIKEQTKLNSKQLDILIKLDYFSQFGHTHQLLAQVDIYSELSTLYNKFKTAKKPSKSLFEELSIPLDEVATIADKSTEKQFAITNNEALLKLFKKYYKQILKQVSAKYPYQPTTILDKIKYEVELLGYTDLIDESVSDGYYIVTRIETNNWGTTFANLYHLSTGYQQVYKCDKKYVKEYPFRVGDILNCFFDVKRKGRYEEIDGKKKWIDLDEYETILKKYSIK